MNTAAYATAITISPKADHKDVYLLHSNGELAATIIEWSDCVELRVSRVLTAEEHDAAIAFIGKLQGAVCTLVNFDAGDRADVAKMDGLMVPKQNQPAVATRPAAAPQPRPRMIVLPSSRSERIQDGWLRNLRALTHNDALPTCWACNGRGHSQDIRSGRDRLKRCNVCEGTGNAEPRKSAQQKVVA